MDVDRMYPTPFGPRRHVTRFARIHPDRGPEPGMVLIGRWIRHGRLRAGMSQATLGRMSGLHPSTISRLERGVLEGLRLHRLAAVVLVLDRALDPLGGPRP